MKTLAIFAVLFALQTPLPLPRQATDHATQNHTKNARSGENRADPTPIATPVSVPRKELHETLHNQPENEQPNNKEAAVRVVEMPSKTSSDWILWIGNVLLVATGMGGIIVAVCTLKKIERQTKATEDAAIAADNSLELSRDTAKRQLRAYMMADLVNIANVANPAPIVGPLTPTDARITHPEWGPVVTIVIRNTGQTPAHDVDHWGNLVYRENPLTSDLPGRQSGLSFLAVIGAGIVISKRLNIPVRLSPDEISGLMDGTGAIYLHGVISYKDVFKESHTTHYRLMYTNGMSKIGISTDMTFAQDGNEAD